MPVGWKELRLILWNGAVVCGMGGMVAGQSRAQATEGMTLAEARARARCRNWDLLAAKADLDLAEAHAITARALPNPGVSFTVQKLDVSGSPGPSTRDTTLALSQLVEIGGKRGDRIRAARADVEAGLLRLQWARMQLDAGLVKAYVAAVAGRESARLVRLSADSLKRSATIAAARLSAGEISEVEKAQVEVAAGRLEADGQAAEATAAQSLIALQVMIGSREPSAPLVLSDDLQAIADGVASGIARLLEAAPDEAARRRPDVAAGRAGLTQAEEDLKLRRAMRVPDPTFEAQYESDLPESPHTLGFGVSVPVPLFYRNRGEIASGEVAVTSAMRECDRRTAQALAEIGSSRAVFDAARKRRGLLHDELLPRAEQAQGSISFAYEKGGASLLELLEAERTLNDLRLADVAACADELSAAADLAAALGETLE
jgi:outer membrane protein, heavy metal efflux system